VTEQAPVQVMWQTEPSSQVTLPLSPTVRSQVEPPLQSTLHESPQVPVQSLKPPQSRLQLWLSQVEPLRSHELFAGQLQLEPVQSGGGASEPQAESDRAKIERAKSVRMSPS